MNKPNFHLSEDVSKIKLSNIDDLIAQKIREDSFIDYKREIPRKLSEIICGFLNNQGGHIVFGVTETNELPEEIIGMEKTNITDINIHISKILPKVDLMPYISELDLNDNKAVIVICIPRYKNEWFYSKGKFIIRQGDQSNTLLSDNEIKFWKNNHPENSTLENTSIKEKMLSKITLKYDKIKFIGIPTEFALSTIPLPTSKAYIPASFIFIDDLGIPPSINQVIDDFLEIKKGITISSPKNFRELSLEISHIEDINVQFVFFGTILHAFKNIIILGDPGSGKSTFTQFLNWCFSSNKNKELLSFNADLIPFYIELKSFSSFLTTKRDKGESYSISDYILYELTNFFCVEENEKSNLEFLKNNLKRGTILICYDGLDEIGDPSLKDEIVSMIKSFSLEYPEVYNIVTSRYSGYESHLFGKYEFVHLYLAQLKPFMMKNFISKWFTLIESDHELRSKKTNTIINEMDKNPILALLGSNPLMLSLIILMANYELTIPLQQFTLYSQIAKTLIYSREAAKSLSYQISFSDIEQLFAEIASSIQEEVDSNKKNFEITRDSLKETITTFFINQHEEPLLRANSISKEIISQLNKRPILLFPKNGNYEFWHRSFLDYFLSISLRKLFFSDLDLFKKLIKEKIVNYKWWETIHLSIEAIGEINRKEANIYTEYLLSLLKTYDLPSSYLERRIIQKNIINNRIKDKYLDRIVESLRNSQKINWQSSIFQLQYLLDYVSDQHIKKILDILLENPSKFQETFQVGSRLIANPQMNLINLLFNKSPVLFMEYFFNFLQVKKFDNELEILKKCKTEEISLDLLISIFRFQDLDKNELILWHGIRKLLSKPIKEIRVGLDNIHLEINKILKIYDLEVIKNLDSFLMKLGILFLGKTKGKHIRSIDPSGFFSKEILIQSSENMKLKEQEIDKPKIETLHEIKIDLNLISESINDYFKKFKPKKTHVRLDYYIDERIISYFSFGIEFSVKSFETVTFPLDIETLREYYKKSEREIRFRVKCEPNKFSLAFRYEISDDSNFKLSQEALKDLKDKLKFFKFELIEQEEFYCTYKAIESYRQKDFNNSLKFANKAINIDPRFNHAYKVKAETLANLKRFSDSQNTCDDYIKKFKEDKWVFVQKTLNFINLWQNKEALKMINNIRALEIKLSSNEEMLINESEAIALYRTGDGKKSLKLFDTILKSFPERCQSHFHKALAFVSIKDFISCLNTLKTKNPCHYSIYSQNLIPLIISLIETDEIDEALEIYSEIKKTGVLKDFLYIPKDNTKLIHFLEKLLDQDPNDIFTLRNLATLFSNSENYKKATKFYEKALELGIEDANFLENYAIFLSRFMQDYENADYFFEKAMKIDPKNSNIIGNYAGFLLSRGKFEKGFNLLEKAMKIPYKIEGLLVELLFYRYAHSKNPKIRFEDLIGIKTMLLSGKRSPSWVLDDNVKRALKDKHPQPEFIKKLAKVIVDEIKIDELEKFSIWNEI